MISTWNWDTDSFHLHYIVLIIQPTPNNGCKLFIVQSNLSYCIISVKTLLMQ